MRYMIRLASSSYHSNEAWRRVCDAVKQSPGPHLPGLASAFFTRIGEAVFVHFQPSPIDAPKCLCGCKPTDEFAVCEEVWVHPGLPPHAGLAPDIARGVLHDLASRLHGRVGRSRDKPCGEASLLLGSRLGGGLVQGGASLLGASLLELQGGVDHGVPSGCPEVLREAVVPVVEHAPAGGGEPLVQKVLLPVHVPGRGPVGEGGEVGHHSCELSAVGHQHEGRPREVGPRRREGLVCRTRAARPEAEKLVRVAQEESVGVEVDDPVPLAVQAPELQLEPNRSPELRQRHPARAQRFPAV
mmetsp:Transcript_35249/g.79548  ORF Transcript_35249/g.79548 Transcript_35249/m.79548 type:complete len:299 (+) Transcript_35249:114-1010(+)